MKVVVFGATGVVGHAAVERFAAKEDCSVVAVSRRPVDIPGVAHVSVDLADRAATEAAIRRKYFKGTTHVVFAALQESHDLVAGWRDPQLMAYNLQLFRHALEPLVDYCDTVEHVSLLQGAKAYGLHVGRSPLPAKESAPRVEHDNFYFLQEDGLRLLADGAPWTWTILRPQVVYGESLGSPMNVLPALGVYAAIERERGRPLSFPGGARAVHEGVDARLLARALEWAAIAREARAEIFNVTNGDIFAWQDVWPTIAETFGMAVGDAEPQILAELMPPRHDEWSAVVDRYGLHSPRDMTAFVGSSWTYADILFGAASSRTVPALLSTIKIRQAGFDDCIDSETMFREWFAKLQHKRLLPSR